MAVLTKVETKDLWQTAYMLSEGSSLLDVHPGVSGGREVYFVLEGDDVARLAQEFRSGRAMCNIAALRASMIHLKEEMFKVINSR
jgi:hypothetical protein